uniref:SCP domain-containing protein n=1 Tax=Cyprinodon variegatus TaxID=28743 RepID=A0A3Q2E0C0_CYPVA
QNTVPSAPSVMFTLTSERGFTQLVWKDSKEVGVGMASSGKKAFIVGRYRPGGNLSGEEHFRRNVLPKGN